MEADEYRKLAAVEDEMWYFRALHRHMAGALEPLSGRAAAVLDAGCGTGGLIRRLAVVEPAWRWTAVDASPLACAWTRQRTAAEVVAASVEALPLAEERFDAVVSADVLYHVDDDAAAVREFGRVLRPGGLVAINVPAHPWLWSYHDEAVQARRRYTAGGLRALLEQAGFAVERLTHWNTLPLPLVVARRKFWPRPADGSDVRLYPRPVEAAFRGLMRLERAWLAGGKRRFGAGSSLLAVGRKRASE